VAALGYIARLERERDEARSDRLTLARRLVYEDWSSFAEETYEVMTRLQPLLFGDDDGSQE
jgi:hypothetical protein